jgi:hypothetical protein
VTFVKNDDPVDASWSLRATISQLLTMNWSKPEAIPNCPKTLGK